MGLFDSLLKSAARSAGNKVGNKLGGVLGDALGDAIGVPGGASAANTQTGGATPDLPISVVRNDCAWFTVKSEDSQAVIRALNADTVKEAGWKQGLDYIERLFQDGMKNREKMAQYRKTVFVSPPVRGYIFITYNGGEDRMAIKDIGERFDDCRFFMAYDSVTLISWMKFENHAVVREYYCSLDGDNPTIVSSGIFTPEERSLGLDKMCLSMEEWRNENTSAELPTSGDVEELAKAWGADPTFGDGTYEKGTGFICRI
ncbi:MAG: hypothetical protein LBR85_00430 [Oscillospiraceae bacterium]|jgi:hypothetical protein|nr:hypothetical protein [Oscillospiraceae bacterium]